MVKRNPIFRDLRLIAAQPTVIDESDLNENYRSAVLLPGTGYLERRVSIPRTSARSSVSDGAFGTELAEFSTRNRSVAGALTPGPTETGV